MTLHPYFPLLDRTHSDFAVFDIEGQFHEPSGGYGITVQTPHANSPQRISITEVDYMRRMAYHTPDTPMPAVGADLFEAAVGDIVGEVGGVGTAQLPPIPLICTSSAEGDVIDRVSHILHFDANRSPRYLGALRCKHYTIAIGKPWGTWQDTIRTVLLEWNDGINHPKVAYMYVFAKGVGLVDFMRALCDESGPTWRLYAGQRYFRI